MDEEEDKQADDDERRQETEQALDDVLEHASAAAAPVARRPRGGGDPVSLRKTLDSRLCGHDAGYLRSTSVKLNDASGMTYTPVSFRLFADRSFSTTSGAHGASFQIVSWASL
jgi:hypothetical protein